MVTVFVVDVLLLLFVPLHDATRQPDEGLAVSVMLSPAT